MALSRVGPGSNGYNFQPEFLMWDCVVLLAPGQTLVTGQIVSRNCAVFPSSVGADRCVLPNHANSSPIYGVYQGPPITNNGTVGVEYPVVVQVRGLGVVSANAPTNAVTISGTLVMVQALPAQQTAAVTGGVQGTYVGAAQATGGITAQGATLIPVGGPTQLVRVALNVL